MPLEVDMLARREEEAWSLTPHEERDYRSDVERRFFEAVEHPPEPTDSLKELVRAYRRPIDQDR